MLIKKIQAIRNVAIQKEADRRLISLLPNEEIERLKQENEKLEAKLSKACANLLTTTEILMELHEKSLVQAAENEQLKQENEQQAAEIRYLEQACNDWEESKRKEHWKR